MPRIKFSIFNFQLLIIILLFSFLLFNLSGVRAQDESCDLCGWCGTDTAQKPSDWNRCMQCLFPSKDITDNYTGAKSTVNADIPNYPSHPETSKNWTVIGCLDTNPGGFVTQIYKLIVAVGSGLAFLTIIYGGFVVLTAGGDPLMVKRGKNTIMGAVFGILLIIFSVFLLRLIGFEIIKIPGFG